MVTVMTKIRAQISDKNEYYISKHEFLAAYHFALGYKDWKKERNRLTGLKGIDYSSDHCSSPGIGRPTENTAIRTAELSRMIKIVDETVKEVCRADKEMIRYMTYAVTNEGTSYEFMRTKKGIPCGKDYYYKRRREFYFRLIKKIWNKEAGDKKI